MNPRVALLAIAGLFVLPAVMAWLIHAGIINVSFDTGEGKNRGELIHPARPLDGLSLSSPLGEPVRIDDIMGEWTMMVFASNPCEGACAKNLYNMRQIRLALGKDAYRAQRIVVAAGKAGLEELLEHNPGTRLLLLNDQSQGLLQQFPGYSEGGISSIAGRIYIIDPLGNLMMRYPPDVNPSDILKDLRQLLKATWIRPKT